MPKAAIDPVPKLKRNGEDIQGASERKRKRTNEDESSSSSKVQSQLSLSQQPDFNCIATMSDHREAGIITEIKLANFMTHGKLTIKLGQHFNFILGLNGSGKSSILTGIIVGLGGKAALTSRGNNVKSLIKHGCNVAEVRVTVRNKGSDAFRHDVYGDSITVVRKITEAAGGGYKMLNANGKVVSSSRQELDAMLDSFNILVDNPAVILNQDTSREFMTSRTPADLYRFFLRATQLEQVENDHALALKCQKEASDELHLKRNVLMPLMEREVRSWQQKYDACACIEKLCDRVTRLKEEMSWAFVWEKERELEKVVRDFEAKQDGLPKYRSAVDKCDNKLKSLESERKQLQEDLKNAGAEADQLEPILSQKKDEVSDKRRSAKAAEYAKQQCDKELHEIVGDRNELLVRIKQLRSAAPVDYAALRAEREQKILKLSELLNDENAKLKTLDFNAEQFRHAEYQCQQDVGRLKPEEDDIKKQKAVVEKRLKDVQSAGSDVLRRFGNWMPQLVREIEECYRKGQFHELPRGPLGAHMKVRDQKWAFAIERCLGLQLMMGFAIHDYHDEKIFEGIMRRICPRDQPRPVTIVSKFEKRTHPVPRNPLSDEYPTVFEMLEIDDPVVANCIIDQRKVEYVLLSDNHNRARELMISKRSGKYGELFEINGDQMFSNPCYRSYPSSGGTVPRFLTTNVDMIVNSCRRELNDLSERLRRQQEQIAKAEQEKKRNGQEHKNLMSQQQMLRTNISKLKLQLNELKNTEEPAPVDVRFLEEELAIHDQKVIETRSKQQDLKSSLEDAKKQLAERESELKDIENRIRKAAEKLEPYQDRLATIDSEIDRAKQEIKHYRQKLKDYEKELAELTKQRDTVKAAVDSVRAKAQQVHKDPIRTRRTAQNIESEIGQVNKQIAIEQKSRGNQEEIKKTYLEKKQKFDLIQLEAESLTMFIQKLSSMLTLRNNWFTRTKESVTTLLKMRFRRNLSLRSHFEGGLKICHVNKVIEMDVRPKSSDIEVGKSQQGGVSNKTQPNSSRTLSGGERSYATMCFIISLWDLMEAPFRFMDEFDIYMDLVNRRYCMDMLLEEAALKPGCQYGVLSPLDMTQLNTHSDKVDTKVLKLAPPRDSSKSNKKRQQ